jgi:non-canonical purine NTP pyrophosphatase (RdgB/HAM1 family)
MEKMYFISKNKGKIISAQSVFAKHGIDIVPLEKDYPEIQADTSLEIARFAALQAAKETGNATIREDHSLFIHALGIPGPYTHYIEKMMPVQKLFELLNHFEDRAGHFEVAIVYAEPNGKTFEYVFQVPVKFAKEIKGDSPAWDNILMMDDETRTFSEYPQEERMIYWSKGYEEVAKYIKKKNV